MTVRRRARAARGSSPSARIPDDVEIGVGGILRGTPRQGTSGGPDPDQRRAGGSRPSGWSSPERAAALVGARLFHAALADTSVSDGADTIAEINAVIDEVQPDDDLHAHAARRPPGPPQRPQRDPGRRPRGSRACSATRRRPPPSTSGPRASWRSTHSSSASSRPSAPTSRRSRCAPTSTRSSCARPRVTGRASRMPLRRAARGGARQRRDLSPLAGGAHRRARAAMRPTLPGCSSPGSAGRPASRSCARRGGEPLELFAADIDPFAAGLYVVDAGAARSCRAATTRFADALLAAASATRSTS